ncbi:MAG: CatA-like O-acetyltransferase, family 2 [Prevotella sp.]|nr:CatA-like O-acetyltransferase, family 2 [Paraprevotella sp.]MDY4408031.1 CatA-like O-acetyltransferase, family 2 [Prevotella sp.]
MKQEITPQQSDRAEAFGLWMSSPMPMVTLVKTMDVTRAIKYGKRNNLGINSIMCWCIGKAASKIKEFFILPEQGKLYSYSSLGINVIVKNAGGGLSSCDIPYNENIKEFTENYLRLTQQATTENKNVVLKDSMIIGTSAMIQTELDCIVNQYTDKFCNPMVMWGKIRKGWIRRSLPISFQFHHVQMDGTQGALFLEYLQETIKSLK